MDVSHKAVFLFDNPDLTDEMKAEKTSSYETNFMVIPWWMLVILIVPIGIWRTLHFIKKKKRKKKN